MRGSNPTIIKLARRILGSAATTFGLLSLSGGNVLAQGMEIEEIIVTAQRREQAIEEVPLSVTTMRGERLTSMFEGGEDIRALAARIPSVYAESSNGRIAPRFYMRGLGNTDFDLAASQSVSILFDEVVQENVILKSFPLFDIERVEVLRGPQGTLFGRNTPAGIIKFDTRKPTEDFEAYTVLSAGSLGTLNAEGAISGSLNDEGTLLGRLSVISQNRDDWIDNNFNGVSNAMGGFSDLAWRGQLLANLSDDLSVLLNVHGRDYDGTATVFRANAISTGAEGFGRNYNRDTVQFNNGGNNPQTGEAYGGSLNVSIDMDNGVSLTSISAIEVAESFSRGDIDGGNPGGPGFIPFQSESADAIDDLDQFTQEFRLSGEGDGGFFWQAGYFFFDSEFTVVSDPFFAPPVRVTHSNTAWALFGQVSLPLNDQLTLTGGIRYTDDEKDLTSAAINDVTLSGEQTSFDVSLLWDVSDSLNVYGRVANGFRAPSIQGRDAAFGGQASTAESETIISFEAGFKLNVIDNLFRLNGAVYHYVVDDMQLTAIGGSGNFVQLINANEGVGSGLDLDAEFIVNENLVLTAGVSISDTEIKDSMLTVPPCGSGQCTVLDSLNGAGNAIVNGNMFPGAPDSTINFTLRYNRPTDTGTLFFFTDWARQGETNLFLYDAVEFRTDGNFEGGLRAGYVHGDDEWEIAVFGRNITDEENVKGAIDFNNNTAFDNEPRIWGLSFRKNWGN